MRKSFYFCLILCLCFGVCCDLFTSSDSIEEVQILSFTASPSTIAEGDSFKLVWNTKNATTITIVPLFYGGVRPSGLVVVYPPNTTTYTLTATNSTGSKSELITVTVKSDS